VSPLLEEIEREFEIPLILRCIKTGSCDRDVSWRHRRQARGLDETGPVNRAVAGPETAEAEIRMLADEPSANE
jgi:hypothetical protein